MGEDGVGYGESGRAAVTERSLDGREQGEDLAGA